MSALHVHHPQHRVALDAPQTKTSEALASRIAELRALGFVIYRKPPRRRGNRLTYTTTTGETVRLEQLEARP